MVPTGVPSVDVAGAAAKRVAGASVVASAPLPGTDPVPCDSLGERLAPLFWRQLWGNWLIRFERAMWQVLRVKLALSGARRVFLHELQCLANGFAALDLRLPCQA